MRPRLALPVAPAGEWVMAEMWRADENGDGVVERIAGRLGELVLRRRGGDLEIIADGSFLISTANDASSRAMINCALPGLDGDDLRVLIGGLGVGYALDEALACERVRHVTVAEIEPAVVRWFRFYGGQRAEAARQAEKAGRAELRLGDVGDILGESREAFDLISIDTDNGPEWLVAESNAGLYGREGLELAARALRPSGTVVYWSPAAYESFSARLRSVFAEVELVPAVDVIDGREREFVMYVARRPRVGAGR